ncbi:unnamed protein product [Auanema sp. JU1783]|nr:unnamed protein product [Auanema sp. JU1783]
MSMKYESSIAPTADMLSSTSTFFVSDTTNSPSSERTLLDSVLAATPRTTSNGMSEYLMLLFGCLFCFLTIVGILGNLIVIIVIAGDNKMRQSVMNILLLNLAVADGSNLLLTVWEWVPTVTYGSKVWMLPAFMCAICRYLEYVFLFTSISTQLIVCIERYIAIIHPIKARILCNRQNVGIAVACAWGFAALFAFPYLHYHTLTKTGICSNQAHYFSWWPHYKTAEFLCFYLFPCAAILCVYSRVAIALWANNQLGETQKCLKQTNSRNDTLRTRRNVVKMLIACGAVYFVCYSPIQILFVTNYLLQMNFNPPYALRLIMNAMTMTCSASNPLLYTLFSMKFRQRLKNLLFCNSVQLTRDAEKQTRLAVYYNINSAEKSF